MTLEVEFALLGLLFLANGLFSAGEITLAALSRHKLAEMELTHPRYAATLKLWRENPSQVLTTMLVSSILATIAFTTLATSVGLELNQALAWPPWALALATFVLAAGATLLSEIAPKVAAKRHPERIAPLIIPVLTVLEVILGPFIRQLVKLIRWISRPFGGDDGEGLPGVTEEELSHLVEEGARAGALEAEESEMIHSILEFGDTIVKEVMIPRTQIEGVSVKATVDQCLSKFIDSGYTRLPVFDKNFDHIVGTLYAKDFLAMLKERDLIILQDVIRPAFFVPESKKVTELLREFRKGKIHMAIVADEYGGTAGLVTLEDLVEEIVGEIRDEYDIEAPPIKKLAEDHWEVEADVALADFVAEANIEMLKEVESVSVGGYVAELLGSIPQKGDKVASEGWRFEVLESSSKRAKRIGVKKLAPKA